jgi:mxaD protein
MATPEITIAAEPDAVWSVVGDFAGLAAWMPGVETCTLDGDVRTVGMMGMEIQEQLKSRDDATRTLSYSIVPGGPAPVESHTATISVQPADGGSRVTWDVDVQPEAMQPMFADIYGKSLDALKNHCES